MSHTTLRIDPLPPIPASLPGDPITGNTGGSSGGGQAGSSLQLSYYLYDHLGNTRMVFHTVLKVDEEDPTYVPDYYPYGKILREWLNCTGERYLTTQHERDIETGYDYRGARFYDADLGRFLSVDPLAAEYAGWSGYAYVLGNPVRLVDPDGRSVDDIVINVRKAVVTPSGGSTVVTTRYEYAMDASGNYGFIDPTTGSLYSGSDKFIIDAGNALNILRSQAEGKSLVDGLVANPSDIEIVPSSGGNGADLTSGSYVKWNSSSTTSAPDELGSALRPAYIGLAHELAHIEDIKNGTINTSTWVSVPTASGATKSIPNAEIYATHRENEIRKEQRLPLRAYYGVTASGGGDRSTKIVSKGQSLYYNSSRTTSFTRVSKKNRFTY